METEIEIIQQDPETSFTRAISKLIESANAVRVQPALQDTITDASQGVARRFNVDQAELASVLTEKAPYYLATINTTEAGWQESFNRWCRTVAGNHARNILKHRKTEKKYEDLVIHLNSDGKRNSHRIYRSDVRTPEQELSIREDAPIWEVRADDIRERVRRVIIEDVVIADLWSRGYTPPQIAKLLKKHPKTVYGKLEKLHKLVIRELGITVTKSNRVIIREGLRELFSNCLRGLS